jgi:hypothetical protein
MLGMETHGVQVTALPFGSTVLALYRPDGTAITQVGTYALVIMTWPLGLPARGSGHTLPGR